MKPYSYLLAALLLWMAQGHAQQITVSFSADAYDQPFTGKVLLYLSQENKEPKNAMVDLERFPCFAMEVQNLKPGQPVTFTDAATSFPATLSNLERGRYYAQVVWDRNLGGRAISESPGNLYSAAKKFNFTKDFKAKFELTATEVVPAPPAFKETQYVKELKVPSPLLSQFLGRPMTVDAAVILPKTYDEQPNRKYPVLFRVSGYGGDYHSFSGNNDPSSPLDTLQVIKVFLDGNCALGHSVYANSDNNGPWGDALVNEFIPHLEKQYRTNGAKFLMGHSSGGWTVLWLQTQYPKVFDGCWSSSPDPVTFANFQKVNLYQNQNMFYDAEGNLRNVATVAGFFPWARMKDAYQMEAVVYRGEQMHSFDAVFSKKGADGQPERICDSKTGAINSTVFEHWKKYDIALQLKTHWEDVKADLDGKVRVSVGNQDNFLLNYAVHELDDQMKELGANFQFGYYIGDHFTVYSEEYQKDGYAFLNHCYQQWLAHQQ